MTYSITYLVPDGDGLLGTKTKTLVAKEVHHFGPWLVATVPQGDLVLRVHIPFDTILEFTETVSRKRLRAVRRLQKKQDEAEQKELKRRRPEDDRGYR